MYIKQGYDHTTPLNGLPIFGRIDTDNSWRVPSDLRNSELAERSYVNAAGRPDSPEATNQQTLEAVALRGKFKGDTWKYHKTSTRFQLLEHFFDQDSTEYIGDKGLELAIQVYHALDAYKADPRRKMSSDHLAALKLSHEEHMVVYGGRAEDGQDKDGVHKRLRTGSDSVTEIEVGKYLSLQKIVDDVTAQVAADAVEGSDYRAPLRLAIEMALSPNDLAFYKEMQENMGRRELSVDKLTEYMSLMNRFDLYQKNKRVAEDIGNLQDRIIKYISRIGGEKGLEVDFGREASPIVQQLIDIIEAPYDRRQPATSSLRGRVQAIGDYLTQHHEEMSRDDATLMSLQDFTQAALLTLKHRFKPSKTSANSVLRGDLMELIHGAEPHSVSSILAQGADKQGFDSRYLQSSKLAVQSALASGNLWITEGYAEYLATTSYGRVLDKVEEGKITSHLVHVLPEDLMKAYASFFARHAATAEHLDNQLENYVIKVRGQIEEVLRPPAEDTPLTSKEIQLLSDLSLEHLEGQKTQDARQILQDIKKDLTVAHDSITEPVREHMLQKTYSTRSSDESTWGDWRYVRPFVTMVRSFLSRRQTA